MGKAHFPGRPAIDAYGNGGFRFADMSHKGSLLILPSGVYGWSPQDSARLQLASFRQVLDEAAEINALLLGTGTDFQHISENIRTACRQHGISLDVMTTGSAARTWNVVLAEGRQFAAALIAVE